MIEDYFKFALATLQKRRLRSALTMLGIFIGIAAIVALISVGQGLKVSVQEQFNKMGTDKIIIEPKAGFAPPGSDFSTVKLTTKDLDVVKRTLGVSQVAGMLFKGGKLEFKDQIRYSYVVAVPTDDTFELFKEFFYEKINQGREIKLGDTKKIVVGSRHAAADFFDTAVKLRDTVKINDQDFRVVGTYKSIGAADDDGFVWISEKQFRELYNITDEWMMIVAKTDQPEIVAERVAKELRKSRNVKEENEDFTISTAEEYLNAFNTILNILNIFLIGVAAISLIVGGIGIMNTMYTSVLERTQEIGVMKAIGARNADIAMIFLIESGVLGAAGGAIGIILGITAAKTIEYIIYLSGFGALKAAIPVWLIIGALLFSFLVGSISGTLPAYRASKLKPTEALRYE